MGIYKKLRSGLSQEVAAAKTGISISSARRIEAAETLPSQREARPWRTRADPFEAILASEIVPMLEAAPGLTATTVLEEMQNRLQSSGSTVMYIAAKPTPSLHSTEKRVAA